MSFLTGRYIYPCLFAGLIIGGKVSVATPEHRGVNPLLMRGRTQLKRNSPPSGRLSQ
jgi:hypothetical protein